jgi:hypothetical protein
MVLSLSPPRRTLAIWEGESAEMTGSSPALSLLPALVYAGQNMTSETPGAHARRLFIAWLAPLGWVLLTVGLASGAGAFAVYRRDPAVLSWPWLGHAP